MMMVMLPLGIFVSCNSLIYDDEGDCSMTYRLRFRYDRNLKWADAFANEVSSIHLYAFDPSGVLVWQMEDRVEPSEADDYSVLLDLPAGDYKLLAWCGLQNDGKEAESFSVPEAREGETRREQLQCALNRDRDESGAYSGKKLYRLFHGAMDVTLPSKDDGGSYDYTMSLTKNTNHVRVILQHLSGRDVDVERFSFRITDENGLMGCDNGLLDDETITYRPWKTQDGESVMGNADGGTVVKGAVADLTMGRMMATHRSKMMLTITNDCGGTVALIPVIDYALLTKDYYEDEFGITMSEQEFLDREDEYVMTFFLDENDKWISSHIIINSWRVVLDDIDL